jgi:hypothetical protein
MIRIIVLIFCLMIVFPSRGLCVEKDKKKTKPPNAAVSTSAQTPMPTSAPAPASAPVTPPPLLATPTPLTTPPYGPEYGPGHNGPGPMPGQINRALYRPSSFFADINNNNMLEPDELKDFEEARFNIFDADRNGALDKKEMENFDMVDLILSKGGENLIQLNDEQKESYKDWRSFILSLKIKNPASSMFSEDSFAKCYPDKVCDELPGQPGHMPHP